MIRERKKTWKDKVHLVHNSWSRVNTNTLFARSFYDNLFFLNKDLKVKFKNTDFKHQDKLLMQAVGMLISDLDDEDKFSKKQISRLAISHNHYNLDIHPHSYYYWVEALVLTLKEMDPQWYDSMEYYWRECVSFPVSYMISQYFVRGE